MSASMFREQAGRLVCPANLASIKAAIAEAAVSPSPITLVLTERTLDLVEKLTPAEAKACRRLHVAIDGRRGLGAISRFSKLEYLTVSAEAELDLRCHPRLHYLGGVWSSKWRGIEQLNLVKGLSLSRFRGDIDDIPSKTSVEAVQFIQPGFDELDILDGMSALRNLEISHARKLKDIGGLQYVSKTIEFVELDSCRAIASYDPVWNLKNIRSLQIVDSAPVPSISNISLLPRLESLGLVGTRVTDKDLSPCLEHPTLVNFGSMEVRGYSPSVHEVQLQLSRGPLGGG